MFPQGPVRPTQTIELRVAAEGTSNETSSLPPVAWYETPLRNPRIHQQQYHSPLVNMSSSHDHQGQGNQTEPNQTGAQPEAPVVPNVQTHPGIKSQVMGGFTLSSQDLKDVNDTHHIANTSPALR